ncbi:hypothetical protein KTH47_11680 [Acinetobacter pittii]|nr:hypothetical protein [Acinetobacter pittii]MCU4443434.1 hypothetical protein [Acinetobacter pittii]
MTIYKPILALSFVLGSYGFSVCKVLFSHGTLPLLSLASCNGVTKVVWAKRLA